MKKVDAGYNVVDYRVMSTVLLTFIFLDGENVSCYSPNASDSRKEKQSLQKPVKGLLDSMVDNAHASRHLAL